MSKLNLVLCGMALMTAVSCSEPKSSTPETPASPATPAAPATPAPAKPAATQPSASAGKTTASGLNIIEVTEGKGAAAKPGDTVSVNYTGKLQDGTKFDSSYDRNEAFAFHLGAGEVIAGWDEGVAGMKVGGKRQLIIPPNLGYGSHDMGKIPPNSTLYFDVELMGINK